MSTRQNQGSAFIITLITILTFPILAQATWEQVNSNGFGEIGNISAYSMAVFDNQLCIGTGHEEGGQLWYSSNGTSWVKLHTLDSDNQSIISMTTFKNCLYMGTRNDSGCEIWRTCDGTSWEQVNDSGFNDTNNIFTSWLMVVFKDSLFVGTYNRETGCEVWRTKAEGTPPFDDWEQVNTDGFGDQHNSFALSIVVFNNYLYVGTSHIDSQVTPPQFKGNQIWRTNAEGDSPFEWEKVNSDGFGDLNNFVTSSMVVFNNYLYADTGNTFNGFEIWRTAALGDPPFGDWEKVIEEDGFGNPNSHHAQSMVIFEDYLYVATGKNIGATTPSCEVWRTKAEGTPPFDDWQQVNTDGFGDNNNLAIFAMTVFDNHLYASTGNYDGCEVWRYEPCPIDLIYGEHSKEANLLRNFRDSVLSQTPEGQEIIRLYYEWSPAIVKAIKEDEEFKQDVKEVIDGVLPLIAEEE